MTFHEKSRWIGLFANLLIWGWYFVTVLGVMRAGYPDHPGMLGMLIPVIIALTIIHVVGHAAVAILKPSEASDASDERDRAIRRRAGNIAYELLSLGLVIVIGASIVHWDAFIVINGVLFVFILAETARYILEIRSYRSGLA